MGCHGSTKILRARSPKSAPLESFVQSSAHEASDIKVVTLPTLAHSKASQKVAPLPVSDDSDVTASPQLTPLSMSGFQVNSQDFTSGLGQTIEDVTYAAAATTAMRALRQGSQDAGDAFHDYCEAAVMKAATKLAGLWEAIAEETASVERTLPLVAAVRARNTLDFIHVLVGSGEPVSMQMRELGIKVSMAEELWVMRKSLLEATSRGDADQISFWTEQVRGTAEDVSVELAFTAWLRREGPDGGTAEAGSPGNMPRPGERSPPHCSAADGKLSTSPGGSVASPEHGSVEAEAAAFVSTLPRRAQERVAAAAVPGDEPSQPKPAPGSGEHPPGSPSLSTVGCATSSPSSAKNGEASRRVAPLAEFSRIRSNYLQEDASQQISYRMRHEVASDAAWEQAKRAGRPSSAPPGRHTSSEVRSAPSVQPASESRFTLRRKRDEVVEAAASLKQVSGRPTSAPPRRNMMQEAPSASRRSHLYASAAPSQSPPISPDSTAFGSQQASDDQDEETWENEMRSTLPLPKKAPHPKPTTRLPPLPPDVAPRPTARSTRQEAPSSNPSSNPSSKPPSPPSPSFPAQFLQPTARETPPPPPPLPLRRVASTPPATTPASLDEDTWWRPEWWDATKSKSKPDCLNTKNRKRFSVINLNFHGRSSVFTRARRAEVCKGATDTSKPSARQTETGESIRAEKARAAPVGDSHVQVGSPSHFSSSNGRSQGLPDDKRMHAERASGGCQETPSCNKTERTGLASSDSPKACEQHPPPSAPRRWKKVRPARSDFRDPFDKGSEDRRTSGHAGSAPAPQEGRSHTAREDARRDAPMSGCSGSAFAARESKSSNAREHAWRAACAGGASSSQEGWKSDAKPQRKRPTSAPAGRRQTEQPMPIRESCLILLGFARSAHPSASELKEAHKRMALQWHPDRPHNRHSEAQATDMFQAGREAYEYLLQELNARARSK